MEYLRLKKYIYILLVHFDKTLENREFHLLTLKTRSHGTTKNDDDKIFYMPTDDTVHTGQQWY